MAPVFAFVRARFVLLSFVSYAIGFSQNAMHLIQEQRLYNLDWVLTQYFVNYVEYGFAKRALVGTLLYPIVALFPDREAALRTLVVAIDMATVIALVVVLSNVLKRVDRANETGLADWIRLLFLLSPVGFMQIGYDVGRSAHLLFLLLFLMAACIENRRFAIAAAILAVSILIHEVALFFMAPLLVAFLLLDDRPRVSAIALMLPAAAAAAAVVVFGNIDVDLREVLAESASLGARPWSRGLLEPAIHFDIKEFAVFAFYALAPLYFLYRFARRNAVPLLAIPALLPLALFALGADYSRWVHLIFIMTVVIVTTMVLTRGFTAPRPNRFELAALMAYAIPFGPMGVTYPFPYSGRLVAPFI